MTYSERMVTSLTELLTDGETLRAPIYGTLVQGRRQFCGFFGLTEHFLLSALLSGYSQEVLWTCRAALDLRAVTVKKSLVPLQSVITIAFRQGPPAKIRVSQKALGIKGQAANLAEFIDTLQKLPR